MLTNLIKQFDGFYIETDSVFKIIFKLKNNCTLSVIMGELSYSTPQQKLKNINDYSEVEIACLDNKGHFFIHEFFKNKTNDHVIPFVKISELKDFLIHELSIFIK